MTAGSRFHTEGFPTLTAGLNCHAMFVMSEKEVAPRFLKGVVELINNKGEIPLGLRRMSFQGQGHFKVKVVSMLSSFQGQGHFKVKVISRSRSF